MMQVQYQDLLGRYATLANVSAGATALSIALLLFTVSRNSASGSESLSQPPLACTPGFYLIASVS
jgi:hypothetical protein